MLRFIALCILLTAGQLRAQETAPEGPLYYTMTPDIITNYQNSGQALGYIRVSIDLMLKSADQMALVEQHMPLLRDAINNLLAEQNQQEIRSLPVRNELASEGQQRLNDLLLKETGQAPIHRLLFTNFLYQ
ncbi:flagellar basal body-associated FliL family protein [Oceanisphaera psychrotolerans]|uniref:Flagellar protein FliL n=1 Tax=Oceanisphaera psychrotolerans TaxID=1414654 RepID=A0A1J4QGR1_9GAMM|nr:flagellar basal body-associated FliL family protein [Oceanisphaera psychrotolerans]OIN09560.1 flagellar basal body-associated protein FliL [Oceanisphaera psychrotolerans]